jgi:hypothetical protein
VTRPSQPRKRWTVPAPMALPLFLCAALTGRTEAQPVPSLRVDSAQTSSDPKSVCSPDRTRCCDGTPSSAVPPVQGRTAAEARALLTSAGLRVTREIARVSNEAVPGRALQTNPRAGTYLCGQHEVWLYTAKAPPGPRRVMRNFHGDSVVEASRHFDEKDPLAMSFAICGVPHGSRLHDGAGRLMVTEQTPPEGTPLDRLGQTVHLMLAPRDDFWRGYAGLTLAEARTRLAEDPLLAGWHFSGEHAGREGRRIVASWGDRSTCTVDVVLASAAPPSALPSNPGGSDPSPTHPAGPLAAGALGGIVAARLLWPSREWPPRDTDVGVGKVKGDTTFGVRRDIGFDTGMQS